ncbi:MAG TPA: hypothetical protein VF533_04205 [Solirubrobacteraceae bacterium]|jgi:transposase-like protein
MDRAWLADRLAAGRSIESLAREAGKAPSTVAYWVKKHGLTSSLAGRHAPHGGVDREVLEALVEEGLSVRRIAERLGLADTSVRYWLRAHGLRTVRARGRGHGPQRLCACHGATTFVRSAGGRWRCRQCRIDAVSRRRRRVKEILIAEAGGCCAICGYARFAGALQFHHRDPADKSFALSTRGVARSLASARSEAGKCVLLCANCHAEVEGGVATIPP